MTLNVILGNPIILFTLLIIGGETALIPAVYFAHIGVVDYLYIIPLALIATLIADSMWYFAGRCISKETILKHSWIHKYQKKARSFSNYFERHSMKFLMISKFVYGTRMAAQILCGIHKIGFLKFSSFNTIGVLAFLLFLLGLAPLVTTGVEVLTDTIYTVQISFALFVLLSLTVLLLLKRLGYHKLVN